MGLKYYSKEIDNSKNFLPFSLNTDIPSYANTSISYHKNYQCPSSLSSSSSKMSMINTHPYTSIQNHNNINYSTQTSYYFRNNTYANISKSQVKSTYISNETILKNLTSMTSLSNTDIEIESQILDKNNQIYQNLKLCPKQLSSKIPFKYNKLLLHQKSSIDNINPYSSSHNYMNLQQQSIIPIDKILLKKNDYSSIYSIENEDSDIETNSNPNTTKIVKKLEVNLAPSCCDKRVLYRTKMPSSFHQQQKLYHSKHHHHQHNNVQPIYTNENYHTIQQQQQKTKRNSNLNIPLHHPIITDKQLKHSLQIKSVSNQLYNEIQQTILNDNQSLDNIYKDKDLCEYPTDFHKILQDQIFAWYPTENYNEDDLIPQTHSILENEQSDKQDDITNLDEEEFCQHDTFEDFFLRRRPKSSCSTLATATKTIISDTISHDISSKHSLLNRHFPSIALGLDKTDVKFIHDIIERSHGDNRVSNRITALREAYIRAINKKLNLIKTKNNSLIDENKKKQHIKTIKHSYVTSKIRNELEKYDELPIHQRITFSDDDDTYSINYQYQKHHCTIPIIVSTTHRILNFVSSLKQQLQEYFHHLRSRILIETTAKSSNHGLRRRRRFHHDLSGQSHRHVSRQKPIHNVVRHSKEHSHGIHRRQQLCRTHSNRSQLQHQLPSDEQHSSHRRRTFRIIPDQ